MGSDHDGQKETHHWHAIREYTGGTKAFWLAIAMGHYIGGKSR